MTDRDLYSQFANEAYNYGIEVGDRLQFNIDFTVVATSHTWIGYDAFAAFDPESCKLVVANAGTDGFMDWLANPDLAILGIEDQVPDAVRLTKSAMAVVSNPANNPVNCQVSLVEVGHSRAATISAEVVRILGGEAWAYNGSGSGGILGSLLGVVGVNAVGNVHYIDSETDGVANWVVTHLGQRHVIANLNGVGLFGGSILPVDVTKIASSMGHGMEQLMWWQINPVEAENRAIDVHNREVLGQVKVALELAIAAGVDPNATLRAIQSELRGHVDGSDTGGLPGGILMVDTPAGPQVVQVGLTLGVDDLTSQNARQIGFDAYAQRQADASRQGMAQADAVSNFAAMAEANRQAAADTAAEAQRVREAQAAAEAREAELLRQAQAVQQASRSRHHSDSDTSDRITHWSPGNPTITTTTKTSFGTVTPVPVVGGRTADTSWHRLNDRDSQSYGPTPKLVVSQASRNGHPVLLDLNGNGIEIATLDRSSSFLDASGDGLEHRTAWAGTGNPRKGRPQRPAIPLTPLSLHRPPRPAQRRPLISIGPTSQ